MCAASYVMPSVTVSKIWTQQNIEHNTEAEQQDWITSVCMYFIMICVKMFTKFYRFVYHMGICALHVFL